MAGHLRSRPRSLGVGIPYIPSLLLVAASGFDQLVDVIVRAYHVLGDVGQHGQEELRLREGLQRRLMGAVRDLRRMGVIQGRAGFINLVLDPVRPRMLLLLRCLRFSRERSVAALRLFEFCETLLALLEIFPKPLEAAAFAVVSAGHLLERMLIEILQLIIL